MSVKEIGDGVGLGVAVFVAVADTVAVEELL
jgi:hypothetical protein